MAIQQIPDGRWVSSDGRWLWRGGQWTPLPSAVPTGPFWFSTTPDWVQTLLLMGLIGLIPFVGLMDIYGYAIVTARNIRSGYRVLPPAGFSYIATGAPVYVLGLAWSVFAFLVTLAVASAAGFAAFGHSHSVVWGVAIGAATGVTLLALLSIPTLPLLVPALEISEREGWRVFRVGTLVRHAIQNWRATWYGVAIFLLWYLMYFALAVVLSAIPFFGGLAAAIAGMPVLAPMIAVPLARFNDPPQGFSKGAANALAAGLLAFWVLCVVAFWGITVVASSLVSSYPEEAACAIDPRCSFNVTDNREAIAHVRRNSQDSSVVIVEVTYINRSAAPATIDPAEYYARTTAGLRLELSGDCPSPVAATLEPGERLTQQACFHLPASDVTYQVHLPWIGWDDRTL
jgi:hypothetical protein